MDVRKATYLFSGRRVILKLCTEEPQDFCQPLLMQEFSFEHRVFWLQTSRNSFKDWCLNRERSKVGMEYEDCARDYAV